MKGGPLGFFFIKTRVESLRLSNGGEDAGVHQVVKSFGHPRVINDAEPAHDKNSGEEPS